MSGREDDAPKFSAGMCRNCSCPAKGHLDSDDRPCFKHEDCHRYEPLGRVLAKRLAAKAAAK